MANDAGLSDPLSVLTGRERAIAMRFADGMTHREIGEALFIAPATVRTHLYAIYQKLGVSTKISLAKLVSAERRVETSAVEAVEPGPRTSDKPVMAVLPFDHLGDARWESLGAGIAQCIRVDLARQADAKVLSSQAVFPYRNRRGDLRAIGRDLKAGYLLDGTLQASDTHVRVSMQLVDTDSGAILWSARHDKAVDDLFTMQDAIVHDVVDVLSGCYGRLMKLRREAARRRAPADWGAWDHYVLGVELLDDTTREPTIEAIRLLQRAVEIDPCLARAWSMLALAHAAAGSNGYVADPDASLALYVSCAERAAMLDPDDMHVRQVAAGLLALRGDLEGAERENTCLLSLAQNQVGLLAMIAESRVAGRRRSARRL